MAKKKKNKSIFSDKKVTVKEWRGLDDARRKAILANPKKRKRVVDAALPQDWYDKRMRSRFLNRPITPGGSETGRELESRQRYMETLTFGEGDRELQRRSENQKGLEDRTRSWFDQYRKEVLSANQTAADAARVSADAGQRMVQGVTASAQADRDRVAALLRDQATQLGQPSQEAGFLSRTNADIATRGSQMASMANAENAAARAAAQYAAARVEAAGLDQLEQESGNRRRRTALDQDRADYATKKGAWREKFINDAISEARKQVMEDRLAARDGLLKQSELRLKAEQQAWQRRYQSGMLGVAQSNAKSNAQRAANSGKSSRGSGSSSKSKSNDYFRRALATIMGSGVKYNRIISASKKGAARGRSQKYGVEWFISQIIARNKTEPISREVAKRAVYTYIKYKGRVPGGVNVRNAPKSPPW